VLESDIKRDVRYAGDGVGLKIFINLELAGVITPVVVMVLSYSLMVKFPAFGVSVSV
jgi:hypothetical protein